MEEVNVSNEILQIVRKAQIDEEIGAIMYSYMASKEKDEKNKKLLYEMSENEKTHALLWKGITKKELKPKKFKIFLMKLATNILGFTFTVKSMQKDERLAQETYELLAKELPLAAKVLEDERAHEKALYALLDEERLHYVGAMVLGLNDALVELTGAIAGVTFALANTRLIALTGIITGVSATLSMTASNYLAERANGNENAFKSSLYTGTAYLITVALLVLPYLLFPIDMYTYALGVMLLTVIFIIFFFNYYISVAKEEPFFKNFIEMAVISLSVAVISFFIGILAKKLLGIDTL